MRGIVVNVNLNRFNSDNLFVIKCKNTNLEASNFYMRKPDFWHTY